MRTTRDQHITKDPHGGWVSVSSTVIPAHWSLCAQAPGNLSAAALVTVEFLLSEFEMMFSTDRTFSLEFDDE